jgi:hypothetical protein
VLPHRAPPSFQFFARRPNPGNPSLSYTGTAIPVPVPFAGWGRSVRLE